MQTRIAIDFSTEIDFIPAPTPRLCPTCSTPMEQHGRAWLCPRQRDEEKRVSLHARLAAKNAASERIADLPF